MAWQKSSPLTFIAVLSAWTLNVKF